MRIGVMTDAACDLPSRYMANHHVEIMPVHLQVGNKIVPDVRDIPLALGFYRSYLADKDLYAETSALTSEEILNVFKDLVPKYDKVICIVITKNRSLIYQHATEASYAILKYYHEIRNLTHVPQADEHPEQFSVRVIDSDNMFTAQGVLVYEAVRKIEAGMSYTDIVSHIQKLTPHVHGFLVPDDLYYLRSRASKRGEKSVGMLNYLVGTALDVKPIIESYRGDTHPVGKGRGFENTVQLLFDKAMQNIEQGLKIPVVAMSYGGDPKVILKMDGYQKFSEMANAHDIETMLSVMSPTAGIHVGPGSFSLAYATND